MADQIRKADTAAKAGRGVGMDFETRKKEWEQTEALVLTYQKQFAFVADQSTKERIRSEAQDAADILIQKFYPLFKKYLVLLKSGQIDFDNAEMKSFVLSFIGDAQLKRALCRKRQKAEYRHQILKRFNFVKETYGSLSETEIMTDMQIIFLQMAQRYKQMGRNFCAYLYNSFRYEVSRHIKKFTRDPANIHYRNCEYEDYMQSSFEAIIEDNFEDSLYENTTGIPDLSWISGQNCSELFQALNPIERKLLVKYYLEDYNDRQIAEEFSIHINTCNQKRRQAVLKLAAALGIDEKEIRRNRKNGKDAFSKPERACCKA